MVLSAYFLYSLNHFIAFHFISFQGIVFLEPLVFKTLNLVLVDKVSLLSEAKRSEGKIVFRGIGIGIDFGIRVKTIGVEPITFPLKEGYSTDRVLLSLYYLVAVD
jgi:hypothetical protein